MSEWFDPGSGLYFVNETDLPAREVASALEEQYPDFSHVAHAIANQLGQRQGNIFQRDRYVTPEKIYEQIKLASHAAKYDDVVAGVLETSESMAFSRVTFECEDEDEQEVWNQIARKLNLDFLLRQMWRESFVVSQFYMAVWPQRQTFELEGIAEKRSRRKKYEVLAPRAVTILDPLRVVPVGNFVFGEEQLAYIANSRQEAESFDDALAGTNSSDLVVRSLFSGRYEPGKNEKRLISELGFNSEHMFLLNPAIVHRYTDTRATYERFADIRLASIFELLDLKNLLRAMDRSMLLGSINYIVLVRIGTDERPAKAAEVAGMRANLQQASRLPVLVGDYRLQVDIISPDNNETLRPERYNTIDSRITARLYSLLNSGDYSAGKSGDKSLELSRIMGRVMESRRQMLRRFIEKTIIRPTFEQNDSLKFMPRLRFAPKRISLAFDPSTMQALLDLRDRGELSRETMLGEFDFSQADEARKRQLEADRYDEIFQTHVPHDSPEGNSFDPNSDPRSGGRNRGGNRNGGGRPEGSPNSETGGEEESE